MNQYQQDWEQRIKGLELAIKELKKEYGFQQNMVNKLRTEK